MSILDPLTDWEPGSTLPQGSHLQEPVDALRKLAAQVSRIVGFNVSFPQERGLCKITNAGPEGSTKEPDYTDARYWIEKQIVYGADPYDNVTLNEDTSEQGNEPTTVTAKNLPEIVSQSHGVPVDGSIYTEYFAWWDNGDPQQVHYFINMGNPGVATLKITGSAGSLGGGDAGGRYKAAILTGSVSNLDPTSNFHPPDANMTAPSSPNAIWVNLMEGGSATAGTRVITAGSEVFGYYKGQDDENPSLPVYYGTSAPAGTLFRVNLTQTGGSAGTQTMAASWIYTVNSLDSVQLLTGASPEKPRWNGSFAAATKGYAYISATGAIVLAEAWEVPGNAACNT